MCSIHITPLVSSPHVLDSEIRCIRWMPSYIDLLKPRIETCLEQYAHHILGIIITHLSYFKSGAPGGVRSRNYWGWNCAGVETGSARAERRDSLRGWRQQGARGRGNAEDQRPRRLHPRRCARLGSLGPRHRILHPGHRQQRLHPNFLEDQQISTLFKIITDSSTPPHSSSERDVDPCPEKLVLSCCSVVGSCLSPLHLT